MCGISGIFGQNWEQNQLAAMVAAQHHRGPDAQGVYVSVDKGVGLGHNRLSIIDLSDAGHQPMCSYDGRVWIVFNGEIYNYVELRTQLSTYPYRSQTDTEVILAAYEHWGVACLDHLIGMFAFLLWDERIQTLFAARDRFGVKPLYYHQRSDHTLLLASEIKALHAAGAPVRPNPITWATYLAYGLYDHSEQTFWADIQALPPGHQMIWHRGRIEIACWYDLADRVSIDYDTRSDAEVQDEYKALLQESVRLRFRADVPVGINLSGGLDSSTLLGLVQTDQKVGSEVNAFTFITGDERYDELPWVQQMLAQMHHPHQICSLHSKEVPDLMIAMQQQQDEPFGGLPTLAYAKLFAQARTIGTIVLLDGQGLDEQWAGYEYYAKAINDINPLAPQAAVGPVQGSQNRVTRPEALQPEFRQLAEPFCPPSPFPDRLRNLQYRDTRYTKIPRALRFNDRVSMMYSTELREPFLDHRLFELSLRQPPERKIRYGIHKWLLRKIVGDLLPQGVMEAPKRPLQTPQREWLSGSLRDWTESSIEKALIQYSGTWLDVDRVREEWQAYLQGKSDNSFYIWQWISLGHTNQR